MAGRTKVIAGFFVLSMLTFLPALGFEDQLDIPPTTLKKNKLVYVCACLKTKSCPCMTEASSSRTFRDLVSARREFVRPCF